MSLSDFIGEGTEISYRDDPVYDKKKLVEVHSTYKPGAWRKYRYSLFHKRVLQHYPVGELIELKKMKRLMEEMYSCPPWLTGRCMLWLWRCYQARRFVLPGTGKTIKGLHYVLLPRELWREKNKHKWGDVPRE